MRSAQQGHQDAQQKRIADLTQDVHDAEKNAARWRLSALIAWAGLLALTVAYWMGGGR